MYPGTWSAMQCRYKNHCRYNYIGPGFHVLTIGEYTLPGSVTIRQRFHSRSPMHSLMNSGLWEAIWKLLPAMGCSDLYLYPGTFYTMQIPTGKVVKVLSILI